MNARERPALTAPDPASAAATSRAGAGEGDRLGRYNVIVEFNIRSPGGASPARDAFFASYERWSRPSGRGAGISGEPIFGEGDQVDVENSRFTENYAFCSLSRATVDRLGAGVWPDGQPTVYKIWLDHRLSGCVYGSVRTIKCDAARAAFAAAGEGVVWAVADTGISGDHPHFQTHRTLELDDGLFHRDFTARHGDHLSASAAALVDVDGHGTHVAGVIAGETRRERSDGTPRRIVVRREVRVDAGEAKEEDHDPGQAISGLAPLCKLLSLKVLRTRNDGTLSSLLAALGYLQSVNGNGRNLRVHGVNLSLGYSFDPEWFGAGQSPLCVEVDRLVKSGVVVVVAAGNGGYGTVTTYSGIAERASHGATINDPGNAELAITVGSTHRDMPHAYGVSYFSAKGPTADGRMKPDLVAPGERIVSCALLDRRGDGDARAPFREESGTSMAAPHVSGAAAAFLSVRREFKGRPERLKEVLLASAMDLRRRAEFQGAGMVDVMKALQSV